MGCPFNFQHRAAFFGVNIDLYTMEETLAKISEIIKAKQCIQHVVINVAKLIYAQKDDELKRIINSCGIVNVDGAGIVLGARLLGINVPERVTGIDLMQRLVEYSAKNGYRIYFLGAEEDVLNKIIDIYRQKYPELNIAGYRNGYFSEEEEENIVQEVKNSGADILFVAMGSPKKEIFLNKYIDKMQVPFVMGVGGSLDVVAGKVKRAPEWVQKLNSEWLFRLVQEPKRLWKRYLTTNSIYAAMLLREFFSKKYRKQNPEKLFLQKVKQKSVNKNEIINNQNETLQQTR